MSEPFMLHSRPASGEHDSSHPNIDIQKMMKSKLNTFISLHWIQKEPKMRWVVDVCLADFCDTSHTETGEGPARPQWPPIHTKQGQSWTWHQGQEATEDWQHHGLTDPRSKAWLHLQNYLCHCPIHIICLQKIPFFRGLSQLVGLQEQLVLISPSRVSYARPNFIEAKLASMRLGPGDFTSLRPTPDLL